MEIDIHVRRARMLRHIAQAFLEYAERGQRHLGRKLDFVVQEMNREVNTVGSKLNDLTVSRLVIELKHELEKIREQVQNIE